MTPQEPLAQLYFRSAGRKLSVLAVALLGLAAVGFLFLGQALLMSIWVPLPLLGIGLAMVAAPGHVRTDSGIAAEAAWAQTRVLVRVVWLSGLIAGVAVGMVAWGLLIPFVTLHQG